jgi:sulfur-oxidizing protein SoxY
MTFTRRETMLGASALALAAVAPATAQTRNDAQDLIRKFCDGRTPSEARVRIDAPEIAENGNMVPMTVAVESPMSEADHVKEVLVVATGNPRGGVCTFRFTPRSGVAEANTRIRLGETQDIIAVAKTSDGSLFVGSRNVKVTIGGCGG